MDNLPKIMVDFVVDGKNFILEELTGELNILPTEIRGIDDWPEAIKNNPNLPEELQPRNEWSICYKEELCEEIEMPVQKILEQIKGKEQILNRFCEKNLLRKGLCITIHAEAMHLPDMTLSPKTVSYLGRIGVQLSFDIYTY